MTGAKAWLSSDEFFGQAMADDPAFRAAWERTAFARAVGSAVVRYRTAHHLTQRQLAEKLRMKPSAVGRLELGGHNPSIETLERLAEQLGMRFVVDVGAAGATPVRLPKGLNVLTVAGGRVLVAAG